MKADVVIIGSGLGGLVCAHLLLRRGFSVLVLERQGQPGGCLQSYRRGDFRFDTGLHCVGGLAEGQSLHEAFRELDLLDLPWHKLDASGSALVTIGDDTFPLAEGFEQFAATLAQYFPGKKAALQQYTGMLQQLNYENDIHQNAYQYLSQLFHDDLLLNVVSGSSLKMELRKDTLPLFCFAHINAGFIESSWRLRGDGNLLVNKLTDGIVRQGGSICCGAEVTELQEKDGRIVATRCSNGETYEADTFICDIHPAMMLELIKEGGKIKRTFRKRITQLENSFGIFTASLLLKPGTVPYFNHNKYVYRESNVWSFYEKTAQSVGGVMVSCRVPEDASPWTQQIDLLTPMPWTRCLPFADTTVGHRGMAYEDLKRRMAAECVELAERVVPGLSGCIAQCYTSTPLTYRDYNHTPEGSAYGIRKDYANPMMTVLSPQTPISNLLLTGQNIALHGLQGVIMAAQQTCKHINK